MDGGAQATGSMPAAEAGDVDTFESPITRLANIQAITDADLCQDKPWAGGVGFDLAAQFRHRDTQVMTFVGVARPPDFFQQVALGEYFASIANECR